MIIVQDGPPLPPPPSVSKCTIPMSGLLVDAYGLREASTPLVISSAEPLPPPQKITCLWLHHARTRTKEAMGDFACHAIAAWNKRRAQLAAMKNAVEDRGLVALAFDQRNHGTRMVDEKANGSWRDGNKLHAVDMMGMIAGMVDDTRGLMDVVEGYINHHKEGEEMEHQDVDMHVVAGKSLGGHSAWQLMFKEKRIDAGVIIVGCPDYMRKLINLRFRSSVRI